MVPWTEGWQKRYSEEGEVKPQSCITDRGMGGLGCGHAYGPWSHHVSGLTAVGVEQIMVHRPKGRSASPSERGEPRGVLVLDPDGRIISADGRVLEETGYALEDLQGMPLSDLLREEAPGEAVLRQGDGAEVRVPCDRSTLVLNGLEHACIMLGAISQSNPPAGGAEQRERDLLALLDTTFDSALLIEPDGTIAYCNETVKERLGDGSTDLVGRNAYELLAPEVAEHRRQQVARVLREGEPVRFTDERLGRVIDQQICPVFNEDGSVARLAIYGRDITGRQRTRNALKASEQQYRGLVEQVNSVILRWDVNGSITYMNPYGLKLFGFHEDELVGRNVVGTIVPEHESSGRDLGELIRQLRQDPDRFATNENENIRKDGRRLWLSWTNRSVLDDQGHLVEILSVGNDITTRKDVERELVFRGKLLNEIQDLVVATDLEGRVTYVNRAVCEARGLRQEELLGETVEILSGDVSVSIEQRDVLEQTRASGAWRGELTVGDRQGRRLVMDTRTWLLSDQTGRATGLCGIATDVTEKRQTQETYRRSSDLIDSIRKAQSAFIAEGDTDRLYQTLLELLVTMTGSGFGFLDEVCREDDGTVYKRSLALSDIPRNANMQRLYEALAAGGFEFWNLNNLAGAPALTGELLIANNPASHPRSGGLPAGHPPVDSFMGIPMYFAGELVGVAGIANRPGGYDEEVAAFLEPLVTTCASVIHAVRHRAQQEAAQRAVAESEEQYRALFETAGDAIFVADPESGVLLDVNREAERLTGYSREELIGQHQTFIHPEQMRATYSHKFREATKERGKQFIEVEVQHRSGKLIPVEINSGGLVHVGGRDIHFGLFRDLTERRRSEEALRESERTARAILDASLAAVVLFDRVGKVIDANDPYPSRFGLTREELIGSCIWDLFPADVAEQRKAAVEEVFSTRRPLRLEDCREGIWNDYVIYPIQDKDGDVSSVAVHAMDITERKQAEEALRDSEMSLAVTNRIANIFLAASEEDMFGNVLRVVLQATESDYGYLGYLDETGALACPAVLVRNRNTELTEVRRLVLPADGRSGVWGESLNRQARATAQGHVRLPGAPEPFADAIAIPLVHHGTMVGQLTVATNAVPYGEREALLLESIAAQTAPVLDARAEAERHGEERGRLERQLHHVQKMEAIGTLAGGIAHDFNNILSAVLGFAELAFEDAGEGSPVRTSLKHVIQASKRARDLVEQILTFSRETEKEFRPVHLQHVVGEVAKLIRASMPATIELVVDADADCGRVMADPSSLHQVVMNLCTNAYQAMRELAQRPAETGRICRLSLSLFQETIDPSRAAGMVRMGPGEYAVLTVGDTGTGMAPATVARIFEPYYTKRGKAEGTGLGLAIVHGIVQAHNGVITVDSEQGRGSVFRMYLPICADTAHSEHVLDADAAEVTGTERILFVDDEVQLLGFAKLGLERLGYSVTPVPSAAKAVDMFREDPDAFDLVVTDYAMPRMTGLELARRIQRIRLDTPIILCTGYSESVSEDSAKRQGIAEFALKPIVARDLARLVRRVLARVRDHPQKGIGV